MSAHYIEEAERLADRVAIMSHGRVVALGAPAQLIAEHAGRRSLDVEGSASELEAWRERAAADGLPTRMAGPSLTYLHAERHAERLPAGETRAATLEDVFVLLTGEYVE